MEFLLEARRAYDGAVEIYVESEGTRSGGFATEVLLTTEAGAWFDDPERIPLHVARRLTALDLPSNVCWEPESAEVAWTTGPINLPSGHWFAQVETGSDIWKNYGALEFSTPIPVPSAVFLSYLSEDRDMVVRLATSLRAAGFEVWHDRDDLSGGAFWKAEIRRAITDGLAVIACFSRSYADRDRTYMNEELTIAISELRVRSRDTAWFLPVRLDDCEIPDRDIGAGETLLDIQRVDLFPDYDLGMKRILRTLDHSAHRARTLAPPS